MNGVVLPIRPAQREISSIVLVAPTKFIPPAPSIISGTRSGRRHLLRLKVKTLKVGGLRFMFQEWYQAVWRKAAPPVLHEPENGMGRAEAS
jgi:hypothetical protein